MSLLQLRDKPKVSPKSFLCRDVIPSARCLSSRDIGWTSLLVDVHIGHTGAPAREPYASLATPDQEIGVALSGRYASEYFHGGRWRRGVYEAGALCLHRPNETRRVRFDAIGRAESSTAMVFLPGALVADASEHLRRGGQRQLDRALYLTVDRDPAIHPMTLALVRAMQQGVDDLYAETAASWLAVHLITRHGRGVSVDDNRNGGAVTDARLARVIELMSLRFADPLTLEDLAAEACVSKYHFTRLFRARMGQTPHSFLTDIRMEAACRMLTTTDLPIAGVAAACGYPVSSHFSTAFAAKYGVAPSEFRQRHLQ